MSAAVIVLVFSSFADHIHFFSNDLCICLQLVVDGTDEFFALDEEQNEAGEIKSV